MSIRKRLNESEYEILCEYRAKNKKRFVPKDKFKRCGQKSYKVRLSDDELELIQRIRGENVMDGNKEVNKKGSLINQLRERYTDKELALLIKGEGLHDRQLDYPTVHLHGKHHKIGVMADGHLGSKYAPIEWHLDAFKTFEEEGCDCILHGGDMVDGLTPRRISTQIYELTHIGYKSQRDLAIDVFSKSKLPIFAINGNHDNYFKEFAGANIVEDICDAIPNMTYLGDNQADINIDGIIIRLFHGGDGNSYALSYRLQKIIESFTGGKKPNILLAAHVHKFCYIFDRHVHAISIPTLQMQTGFMQGKKLAAHTGFLIMEFDTFEGSVCNFQVKLYPFYG